MHRSLLELAVALVVGLSTSCSQMASPTCAKTEAVVGSKANSQPDEFAVNNSPLKLPLVNPKIVVRKTQRRLMLYSNDKLVRVYRVGLGLSPIEDKVKAGDRRTPEGEFYVFTKNDKSAFYLSLGLSYPNEDDARRGTARWTN